MSHEILSVKLCELDQKIGRLHGRIHISESARREQIEKELEDIRRECEEAEFRLRENLRFSKAKTISVLSDAFGEVEQIIEKAKKRLGERSSHCGDGETDLEEKILTAEYALDFAMLAADHALLMSMEAIDAQMKQEEKEEVVN